MIVKGAGGSRGDDLQRAELLDEWHTVVEGFHDLTRSLALDVLIGDRRRVRRRRLRVRVLLRDVAARWAPEVGIGLVVSRPMVGLPAAHVDIVGRTGRQALEHGLVNSVVEPDQVEQRARVLAAEIAGRAPLAVRATKRLLVDALHEAVEQAMARETEALVALCETADMREGFAAFREKRPASFSGA